jgi:hypothetical protein
MSTGFWGYFVSTKEIVDIYLDAGGELHSIRPNTVAASNIARRSIVEYLMPGRVRVYLDTMDSKGAAECGLTFMIGPDDIELDDIPEDLLKRCYGMFLRDPDHFIREKKPKWKGFRIYRCERDEETIGMLENLDFLEYVFFATRWCSSSNLKTDSILQVRRGPRLSAMKCSGRGRC